MKYERDMLAPKKDESYSSKKKVEVEGITRKDKIYKRTAHHETSHLKERKEKQYKKSVILEPSHPLKPSQKVFNRTQSFEWDLFQWTDYDFVRWANQQPSTLVIAIMAEIKQSPRMKPSIEMLRPKVASIPLCSIDMYRKKKRLGERSVDFLRQMKKKYGQSILRILYVTLDA